jgi:hypothetical protein
MGYTWDILILILFINDVFLRVPSRWGHDSVHRPVPGGTTLPCSSRMEVWEPLGGPEENIGTDRKVL